MPRKRVPTTATQIIEVPLYGSIISVFIEPRRRKDSFEALAFQSDVAPNSYGVVLRPDASPGQIAHEALHVAHWISEELSLGATAENDEPLAYLIQFLTDALSAAVASAAGTS